MLRELSESKLEQGLELFRVATHWIIRDSEQHGAIVQTIFTNMFNDSLVDNSRILYNSTQPAFI